MGWGYAKGELQKVLERTFGEAREKYFDLMAHPERIDEILHAGAEKARPVARAHMEQVREVLGYGKIF